MQSIQAKAVAGVGAIHGIDRPRDDVTSTQELRHTDAGYGPQPSPSDLRSSHVRVRGASTDQNRQRRTVCGHRTTGAVEALTRLDEARDRA